MADARQCDRCGKFYLYDNNAAKRIVCKTYSGLKRRIGVDDPNYYIDLCESCLNELKGWWIKIAYLSEANKKSESSEEDK